MAANHESALGRDRLGELVGAGLLETDADGRYRLSAHGRGLLEALRPLSAWAEAWGASSPGRGG
jgi:DNA-binding HxlR family transcriptional regulator